MEAEGKGLEEPLAEGFVPSPRREAAKLPKYEFRFPALLSQPPADPGRWQPSSARSCPSPQPGEWNTFKLRLTTRRVAPIRAVAAFASNEPPSVLPPILSARPIIATPQTTTRDILRRHDDGLERTLGYNFIGAPGAAPRQPPRRRMRVQEERIFPPDEMFAVATRSAAASRRQASKVDRAFVDLLVRGPTENAYAMIAGPDRWT